MIKIAYVLMLCSVVLSSFPTWAEDRGVTIDFVSDGRGLDLIAVRAMRKAIGTAIASGVVDSFIVKPPSAAANSFSACIEAGTASTAKTFEAFVKRIKFIHPKLGTVLTVAPTSSCSPVAPNVVGESGAATAGAVGDGIVMCGGSTGVPCPANVTCIDDPRDTCDPATGGQNCANICSAQ